MIEAKTIEQNQTMENTPLKFQEGNQTLTSNNIIEEE